MQQTEKERLIQNSDNVSGILRIAVGIWNMQGLIPPTNSIKTFIDNIRSSSKEGEADLICIATQECQRSIGMSFLCVEKSAWENCLREAAKGYTLVDSQTMSALHIAILVKEEIAKSYFTARKEYLKAGLCNLFANKGAISLTCNIFGQSLQFINCHLEASHNSIEKRNEVLIRIMDNFASKDSRCEIFLCGDLNYRIGVKTEHYKRMVGNNRNIDSVMNYSKMFYLDQLTNSEILKERFLPVYEEKGVNFPPTYKMSKYGPEYNRERVPGWTDRIFHRRGRAQQTNYQCFYHIYGTDHRPIMAEYLLEIDERFSVSIREGKYERQNSCCLI